MKFLMSKLIFKEIHFLKRLESGKKNINYNINVNTIFLNKIT